MSAANSISRLGACPLALRNRSAITAGMESFPHRLRPGSVRRPAGRLVRRLTMHMLHLLRHAKSSWKEDVSDRERRLSRRGRETARRVARHLPAAVGALDLVLCSGARRTRETLDLVLAEFAARPRCLLEVELYAVSRE